MRETIYDMWNSVMNADHNPLKNIPSLQTRHMMKPNTWREIEDMLLSVGFSVIQPFWRNHAFVGAIANK